MQIYSERVSLGEAAITIRGASHNGDRVSRYTVIITITDTINEATITRGVARGKEERVIVPWAVISSCYQVTELPATVAASVITYITAVTNLILVHLYYS